MDNREMARYLADALRRMSVDIRVEPIEDSQGGFCILEGEGIVLISPNISLSKKIDVFITALSRLDTSGIYLPPVIRELIEEADDD